MRVLASDAYEGREPGTAGEALTLAYIVQQFAAAGLEPAGDDGSWYQAVPLARVEPAGASIILRDAPITEGVAFSAERAQQQVALPPSPAIFVGYALESARLGRDDLAGADLKGKIALFLPGLPQGANAARWDGAGDFAAKLRMLERRGAAAAIALYPPDTSPELWAEAAAYFNRPRWILDEGTRAAITGAIARAATRTLLAQAGESWEKLQARAQDPRFRAAPLRTPLTLSLSTNVRRLTSYNVLGRLPGSVRPQEHVLFTAHWDGLGRCAPDAPDPICNGAIDNASGVAALIELAQAFAPAPRPSRSLLFIATTAEEWGLLGARWFARHPTVPLSELVGGLNFDITGAAMAGDEVAVLGEELTDLDPLIAHAAQGMGRRVAGAPSLQPFFERSDSYAFAEAGVPVLMVSAAFADRVRFDRFMRSRYHKPSDEYSLLMDLRGAAQDVELARRFGLALANMGQRPGWRAGSNPSQPGGGKARAGPL